MNVLEQSVGVAIFKFRVSPPPGSFYRQPLLCSLSRHLLFRDTELQRNCLFKLVSIQLPNFLFEKREYLSSAVLVDNVLTSLVQQSL